MTKQVQRRRGTATQHTSFTGAEGEISVNTTNKTVHVHDGVTAGGVEAARADLSNVSDANLNSALSGNTVASLTITSADINGGTIDGVTIGGASAGAGTFTSVTGTSLDMNGNADFAGNLNLSRSGGTSLTRTTNTDYIAINSGSGAAFGSNIVLYAGSHASLPNYSVFNADTMLFRPVDNSPEFMRFVDGTGVVFNETGADLDFRVESDTNTSAFVVRGSDGRVGVNEANPSTTLDVNGAAAINDTLLISRAAVAPKITFENSSYAGGDGGIGYFNSGALTFDTNAAERVRIDASGHAIIPGGVTLGTAAGTYNAANTLDDYEEGTWTPVYQGQTTAGSFTYDLQSGYYTKIGNLVTATFYLRTDAVVSAAAGNLMIEGLPFVGKTTGANEDAGCGFVGSAVGWGTQYPVGATKINGAARMFLRTQSAFNVNTVNLDSSTMVNAANSNFVSMTLVYYTN